MSGCIHCVYCVLGCLWSVGCGSSSHPSVWTCNQWQSCRHGLKVWYRVLVKATPCSLGGFLVPSVLWYTWRNELGFLTVWSLALIATSTFGWTGSVYEDLILEFNIRVRVMMRVRTSWRLQLLLNLYRNIILWVGILSLTLDKSASLCCLIYYFKLRFWIDFSKLFFGIWSFHSICIWLSNCILNSAQ